MSRIHPLTVRCEQCQKSFQTYRASTQLPRFCSRRCSKLRPAESRFWAKVVKSESCWTWTAGRTSDGYGSFKPVKEHGSVLAHRYSYQLAFGPIKDGAEICHRCDNPSCVRPDHLFAGSHALNMQDAASKGRVWRREERAIVTPDVVEQLQAMRGICTQAELAKRFKMSPAYVSVLQRRGHSSSSQKVKQPL